MEHLATEFYKRLIAILESIKVTDAAGASFGLYEGIDMAGHVIRSQAALGRKLMFIGNGANASISSHMSADFSKNVGVRAMAFNDAPLLTAVANDHGVEDLFATPILTFADAGDVLIAMSSSGRSPNILHGVSAARAQGCKVITLSAFAPDNPLRSLGDVNFYADADTYALAEVTHHSICHCLLHVVMAPQETVSGERSHVG